MKNQTKQQLIQESISKTEEDADVQELREQKEARARQERMRLYIWGGVCLDHDRSGCSECRRRARGECPSAKEEGYSDSW